MKNLFAIILSCLSYFSSDSQDIKFQRFNKSSGLPGNSVHCFLKDNQGFMWIGTTKGLARYDGYQFHHYTKASGFPISDDNINKLLQDENGKIWIGTETGGINIYDPVTDTLFAIGYKQNVNSLASDRIMSMTESEKYIWTGHDNAAGLSRIDKKTLEIKIFDPHKNLPAKGLRSIREIIVDEHQPHILWLTSTTYGLLKMDARKEEFWRVNRLSDTNEDTYTLFSAYQMNHQIIVGSFGSGTDVYDTLTGQWLGSNADEYDPIRIFDMTKKSETEVWLAARKKGLAILNLETNKIARVASDLEKQSTPFPGFTLALYLNGESLWVGSQNGASFYNSEKFSFPFNSLNLPDKLYGRIRDISGSYDKIYLSGVSKSIWEVDKITGKKRAIDISQGNKFRQVSSHVETKDFLILMAGGNSVGDIVILNKKNGRVRNVDFASKIEGPYSLRDLVAYTEDQILVATWLQGILKLNLKSLEVSPLFDDGANPPQYFHGLLASDGKIWFSSHAGISIFNPEENSVQRYIPEVIPSKSNPSIYSVIESEKGIFWICTAYGLIRLENGEETLINADNSSLASSFIINVLEDEAKNLWLRTDIGLSKLNPNTMHIQNFNGNEGMKPSSAPSLIDGKIWIGQSDGYSVFHPDSIPTPEQNPRVHFTGFKVMNEKYKLSKHIDFIDRIDLDYFQNFIEIAFTSPTFSEASELHFEYRLEGLDQDWIFVKERRTANYTDLDGGHYTFLVRARNKEGFWGDSRKIAIYVASPFWEAWWFYLLCVLTLLSAGFLAYKIRVRELQRKADMEAQELRVEAFQKRLIDLNATPPDLHIDMTEINSKLQSPLSEREFETLKLSLDGKSNAEIGEALFISVSTVKFHLTNIYGKLGVSNRKEALDYVVKKS